MIHWILVSVSTSPETMNEPPPTAKTTSITCLTWQNSVTHQIWHHFTWTTTNSKDSATHQVQHHFMWTTTSSKDNDNNIPDMAEQCNSPNSASFHVGPRRPQTGYWRNRPRPWSSASPDSCHKTHALLQASVATCRQTKLCSQALWIHLHKSERKVHKCYIEFISA